MRVPCKWKNILTCLLLLVIFYQLKDWYEYGEYRREDKRIHRVRTQEIDTIPYPEQENFQKKCILKEENLLFLKTHKTASSTMTSIFNRYADLSNLDIALPLKDMRFHWPYPFKASFVDITRLKSKKANILCNHAVFDRMEFYKVMKTPFHMVTILRDPISQFYSMFHYGHFTNTYALQNYTDPVAQFIEQPSRYFRRFKSRISLELFQYELLLLNGQTFDLNFGRFQKRISNYSFGEFVKYIEKTFHLVLITEYFDEGLLLLKYMLCWDYFDIIYQKKMVHKHSRSIQPSKKTEQLLQYWNRHDMALYNHFKKKFLNIIHKLDQESFNDNLIKFQTLNTLVAEFCFGNGSNYTEARKTVVVNFLNDISEEKVPTTFVEQPACFCSKLARNERSYMNYFRKKYPPFYYLSKQKDGKDVC